MNGVGWVGTPEVNTAVDDVVEEGVTVGIEESTTEGVFWVLVLVLTLVLMVLMVLSGIFLGGEVVMDVLEGRVEVDSVGSVIESFACWFKRSTSSFFKKRPSIHHCKGYFPTASSNTSNSVIVTRTVQIRSILLSNSMLAFPLCSSFSSQENAGVLLGIHVHRFLLLILTLNLHARIEGLQGLRSLHLKEKSVRPTPKEGESVKPWFVEGSCPAFATLTYPPYELSMRWPITWPRSTLNPTSQRPTGSLCLNRICVQSRRVVHYRKGETLFITKKGDWDVEADLHSKCETESNIPSLLTMEIFEFKSSNADK